MGKKRIKKAFLFLKKGKNEKIADFTLQEDPFCTKSKILAKGGVAWSKHLFAKCANVKAEQNGKSAFSTFEMKLLGLNR